VKRDAGNMFFVFPQVFCKNFNFFLCFYIVLIYWLYIYFNVFSSKKRFFYIKLQTKKTRLAWT
jgi:hypothetical protein